MSIPLRQTLGLVGKLDDSPGEGTSRERFRNFLEQNLLQIGDVRDYVEECLRLSGDQYNRAFQDLVNHVGRFLGFEVTYGRYRGVQGQIGFDGIWKSPSGLHVVIEVKTTEAYAVKTATLVGYVDRLISQHRIPSWDDALGLYVVGRPDPETRQLNNAIVAEKRTHQLRIVSVASLLSLAEMMTDYEVHHDDILELVRPSGPTIDSVIHLMERLVSGSVTQEPAREEQEPLPRPQVPTEGEPAYWLSPVRSYKEETAEECIRSLVGENHIYAFGERTPGRKRLKAGDWISFYETGKGVVAHARVVSAPVKEPHPAVRQSHRYPWVFRLDKTKLYLHEPVVIDASVREELDAFTGRDLQKSWAWFVQATRKLTEHDFVRLTRA